MALAVQVQPFVATRSRVAARPARRVVRVCAQQGAEQGPLRLLAAGLAAAALVTGSPAQAGVILSQPEVKNFVKNTAPAAALAAPAADKPAAKKAAAAVEESGPVGGFEGLRPLVLPASVVAIAGAAVALSKVDPEFMSMMDDSWGAKNSNNLGAGYETTPGINTKFYGGSSAGPSAKAAAKPAKKAATKSKSGSILGSILGSRDS